MYDLYYEARALADLDTTFVDVDCSSYVPSFATRIFITALVELKTVTIGTTLYWRANGSSATNGQMLCYFERIGTDQRFINQHSGIITDSGQIFEIKFSTAGDDQAQINLNGWYFPIGM
jgi:hypothetical protein